MTEENWVADMKHHTPSPWRAIGWVAFTVSVSVAPVVVWAGWRWLL